MTFRRAFVAVLAALAVLVAGFAVLDRAQGPKLSSSLADPIALTSEPAQSVQLTMTERVVQLKKAQVRVSPAAAFTLATSAQQVALRFPQALRYSTTYRITLTNVTSPDDGASSTLTYSFRTPAPSVYYLKRSVGGDQILATGVDGAATKVVYSATRIQDFAVISTGLAVVTEDDSGNSTLALVDSSGHSRQIALPGSGTIGVLHSDPAADLIGFTFTGTGTASNNINTLFTLNTATGTKPTLVKGLGGKPLALLNWYFVPGSTQVVGLGGDGGAVLADPSNPNGEVPFGSYFTLNSVSPDGTAASVSDITGALSLALPSGKPTRLTPSTLDGQQPIGGAAQLIPGGWLQIDSIYGKSVGSFTEHLVFDNGTSARELFTPSNPLGSIDSFAASPNSQYVSIEVTPDVATAKPDGYRANGRPTSVVTEIVDVATGKLLATLPGFDAQW